MKLCVARVVAAFWLLVLSLTSLTLAQAPAQTASAPAAGSTSSSATTPPPAIAPAVTGTGTTDFIPLWTNSTGALGNSVLFQSGTGTAAKIGINTSAPATALDVAGGATVRGTFALPTTGNASATAGRNSQAQVYNASAFNSGTAAAVLQKFQWQAEPAGNDTATPSGTLNLLFGSGAAAPTETGLKISSKGVLTFAPGQTFPGGGSFCIATGGGFGGGGTTFVAPAFTVPAANKCAPWSGFTKTASTVILNTSGAACLSTTGKTLTVSVSSLDPAFFTDPVSDYIQLTRTSSTGTFTGGTDQGQFAGSADQTTCTSGLLSLPDIHD